MKRIVSFFPCRYSSTTAQTNSKKENMVSTPKQIIIKKNIIAHILDKGNIFKAIGNISKVNSDPDIGSYEILKFYL